MTEPVQGVSTVDSQLRIDEERSLEVHREVIVKLYLTKVQRVRIVNGR